MTFEAAFEARISRDEAIREVEKHGIYPDYEGSELFDAATGETIAFAGRDGMFAGGEVLAWLGY